MIFVIYELSQSVSVNGESSRSLDVKHGVPQGSCLFILYASKLFTIVERRNSTLPSNLSLNMPLMLSPLCKRASLKWVLMDKLMLNDEKTEFIVIGTRQQLVNVN